MHDIRVIEKSDKYGYEVAIDGQNKYFKSKEYNYIFDMKTGRMISWGRTFEDDPVISPINNILDLEITTICKHGCPFCYKSNTRNGVNMSFDTFKKIIDVQSRGLTQVALGADYDLTANPDIWKMMQYARENLIIPNITLGYCDDDTADKLAKYCGAVAVSRYEDKDACYDTIKRLTDRGMEQVNMHYMISMETYDRCLETLNDIVTDPRLSKLNAIVLLGLKTKGRGIGFHTLTQEKFDVLCDFAKKHNIGIGFDSCNSLKALRSFGQHIQGSVLDCEAAGLQSSYINVKGEYYPCSFAEGCDTPVDWTTGLNVLECNSTEEFLEKIWRNPKTLLTQSLLLESCEHNECHCRTCPFYEV